MNREQAKQLLPIIAAFAEGKDVQALQRHRGYETISDPNFDGHLPWRVKPEPREWVAWVTPKGDLSPNSDMGTREKVRVREILDEEGTP